MVSRAPPTVAVLRRERLSDMVELMGTLGYAALEENTVRCRTCLFVNPYGIDQHQHLASYPGKVPQRATCRIAPPRSAVWPRREVERRPVL